MAAHILALINQNKWSSSYEKNRSYKPSNWLDSLFIHETGISTNISIFFLPLFCCCCRCWLALNLYQRQQQQHTALSSNSTVYCSIVRGMSSSLWHQLSLSGSLFSVRCKTSFESSLRLLKTSWYEHLCLIFAWSEQSWMTPFVKQTHTKKKLCLFQLEHESISSFSILFVLLRFLLSMPCCF